MFRAFSINRNPVVREKIEKSSQKNFDCVSQNKRFLSSQISKEKTALPSLKKFDYTNPTYNNIFKTFLNS